MDIVRYNRVGLVARSLIALAVGSAMLGALAPDLSHLIETFRSGGQGRLLMLLLHGFALGALGYGLATGYRALRPLDAIRTEPEGLFLTTLFGTTFVAWDAFEASAFDEDPKSREPMIFVRYRNAVGAIEEQVVHLKLAVEPSGGFAGIPSTIAMAHARAIAVGAMSLPDCAPVPPAVGGFGRKGC